MPSPNHCDEAVGNSCDSDEQVNHSSFLFSDKRLTDLLSSENVGDISMNSANENNPLPESNEELILRLEAKLLSSDIQLQAEQNERIALHNQVELLMGEIDSLKKTDRTQKKKLKKLISENDKLRKDISRVSSTRKYAEINIDTAISTRCASSTQTDYNESHDEYTALKSKLVSITDSLLTALDDCMLRHRRARLTTVTYRPSHSPIALFLHQGPGRATLNLSSRFCYSGTQL